MTSSSGFGSTQRAPQVQHVKLFEVEQDWEDVGMDEAPKICTLLIEVLSARHVKAADRTGFSDPYCRLTFGDQRRRTCIVKKSLQPCWNESFNLSTRVDPFLYPVLAIDLFDHDQFGQDDFLGRVELPISCIPVLSRSWYPLRRGRNKQEVSGELLLDISKTVPQQPIEVAAAELSTECRMRGFDMCVRDNKETMVWLPGRWEKAEMLMEEVTVEVAGLRGLAQVFLTNCRLVVLCDSDTDSPDLSMSIPLDTMSQVSSTSANIMHKTASGVAARSDVEVVIVACLDVRTIRFVFASEGYLNIGQHPSRAPSVLLMRLRHHIANRGLLSISHEVARLAPSVAALAKAFDMETEMFRQGAPSHLWRATMANVDWSMCGTYPSTLFVPVAISDHVLAESASFRSKGRLPALTWYNNTLGNCIVRSAQPLTGATNRFSTADEDLLRAVLATGGPHAKMAIFDARSFLASTGNKLAGKGTEDVQNRYTWCKQLFLDLGNIHALRGAYDDLVSACQANDSTWLQSLDRSQWLHHLQAMLLGACRIARYVGVNGVCAVVHCSDGWDRTSSLCSLAQLMMDGYFRTLVGFRTLIQKDWLAFGHKYGERLSYDDHERSPVFLQFLDCTWQILRQHPTAFEFTADYLLRWTTITNTNWFGDFLHDNEQSRMLDERPFISFFAHLDAVEADFVNPSYEPTSHLILPVYTMKRIEVWREYFFRYDEVAFRSTGPTGLLSLGSIVLGDEEDADGSSGAGGSSSLSLESGGRHQTIHKSLSTPVMTVGGGGGGGGGGAGAGGTATAAGRTTSTVTSVMWMPDGSVSACCDCRQRFTAIRRRHHCRNCGKIFCHGCVKNTMLLGHLGYVGEQRVCDSCFRTMRMNDA